MSLALQPSAELASDHRERHHVGGAGTVVAESRPNSCVFWREGGSKNDVLGTVRILDLVTGVFSMT